MFEETLPLLYNPTDDMLDIIYILVHSTASYLARANYMLALFRNNNYVTGDT